MEFEDMQVIWNSQNNEKLFAINESALNAVVKRKSRSVGRWLDFFEWVMIFVNLFAGIILIVDAILDDGPGFQFVISAMYIAYAIYAVIRRMTRQKQEVHFPHTILGDLDKAIWQIDYLIQQTRSIALWYVLPLGLVVTISMFFGPKPLWGLIFLLIWFPVSYFGTRWEINKWQQPKKHNLEALREKLLSSETE